jgi:glycosyltransferase involved in cell wall biosynthesis
VSRLRVLWVTDEVPDRALGGGSIRQFHLLERLGRRAEIDLLVMGHLAHADLDISLRRIIEVDPPPGYGPGRMWFRHRIGFLPGLLPAEVATVFPKRRSLSGHVEELLTARAYDIVQVEHETLAPLGHLRSRAPQAVWTLTLHNLLSTRLRQWADSSPKRRVRFLLRRDASNADRLERWIMRSFDQVVAVSPVDAATLGGSVTVVPNGVDLDGFQPYELPDQARLILSGSWNWPPNVDGAVMAVNEVLPRVRQKVPGATLILVGREPTREVRDLSSAEGVETHFDVPSVVPFLRSSRVALVPLSVGSGTRLKALEAMAAGRPVVGTAIGLDGLGLLDRVHARVADSPEEMAAAAVELLLDDRLARSLAAAGRRHVQENFDWDAMADAQYEAWTTASRRR